ncbi:hypothetical protein GCM10009630_39470 [Kribbella jejuensis]
MLAEVWVHRLDNALGRRHRHGALALYRWDDDQRPSEPHPDGSLTLSRQTATWMRTVGDRLYNATYDGQFPPPTRADIRAVRAALADFGDTYLDSVQPVDRTSGPAAHALDVGVRANTVDISGILAGSRGITDIYPAIDRFTGPDRYPLLQGAAAALTEQVSRRTGMRPGEVDALLRQTAAGQRFEAVAEYLVARDPQQRRLPDGSPRLLPDDHVDRLRTAVAHELEETFRGLSERDPQSSRGDGQRAVEQGMRNVAMRMAEFRDTIHTDQRGYAQVASVVAAVQSELATSPATTAAGRDSGALTLQLKPRTDYWSGELRETSEVLGAAGVDRSLTFDRDRVIAVLAAVDPWQPPSPTLRAAVRAVGVESARLCNPEGVVPTDAVGQALEDELARDFAERQEPRLLGALGFDPQQLADESSPSATAQVVATLAAEAGRHIGLEADDVKAQLLTTPPKQRLEKAVALSLAGSTPTREQRDRLTADLRAALTSAMEADHDGKTKLHTWRRSTAGESLAGKVTSAIHHARKGAPSNNLQRLAAAATTGQPPPGTRRPTTPTSTPAPAHHPAPPTHTRDSR